MHTDLTVRATSVAPGHVRLQVRGELDNVRDVSKWLKVAAEQPRMLLR